MFYVNLLKMNFTNGFKNFVVIKNRKNEVIFTIEISETEFEILKSEPDIKIMEI